MDFVYVIAFCKSACCESVRWRTIRPRCCLLLPLTTQSVVGTENAVIIGSPHHPVRTTFTPHCLKPTARGCCLGRNSFVYESSLAPRQPKSRQKPGLRPQKAVNFPENPFPGAGEGPISGKAVIWSIIAGSRPCARLRPALPVNPIAKKARHAGNSGLSEKDRRTA
jgi:hypothetical protein